jgi:hypothetical protein
MPEQDADLLQVLIGQVAEESKINIVLRNALSVLGHAELFEPVRYLVSSLVHSRRQLIEQGLGLFQIERVEALGEPAVDRSENIASLLPLALVAPQPRHAHRRA